MLQIHLPVNSLLQFSSKTYSMPTVFFTPLLLARLHLAFAFPIVWKLLQMFNFTNMPLIILVTVGSFAVFALVYALAYKITSNAYFSIVSGAKEA